MVFVRMDNKSKFTLHLERGSVTNQHTIFFLAASAIYPTSRAASSSSLAPTRHASAPSAAVRCLPLPLCSHASPLLVAAHLSAAADVAELTKTPSLATTSAPRGCFASPPLGPACFEASRHNYFVPPRPRCPPARNCRSFALPWRHSPRVVLL